MNIIKNEFTLHSSHNQRPFLCDGRIKEGITNAPTIIFVHGFKGFKDWGHFNLVADWYASKGYAVFKLNLSLNGTTPESPVDFVDLEAFGKNNFSIELDDIGVLLDAITNGNTPMDHASYNKDDISLIGHSRGGGLVLLKSREDDRVKRVVTWAAIHDLSKRWPQSFLDQWKKDGVTIIPNGRTGQDMPLYYQVVEDFFANRDRLDIPTAVKSSQVPLLVFHGTDDSTLNVSMAHEIKSWNPDLVELEILENANHVFGGMHPYENDILPDDTLKILERSLNFLTHKS